MKWWSSGPLAAKSGTCVHSSQPSSPVTSRTGAPSPGTTGPRLSANRWPGTPSETPTSSLCTSSAFTASTVPPTVMAVRPLTLGEALYAGWPSTGTVTRPRSQPARCLAISEATCARGTCRTMSPSRFRPPVLSESSSQGSQSSPVQASQARGGLVGSTPTPSMDALKRSRTALDGTASVRPT